MANGGRIEYSVGFKADATSLNNIKSQLAQLKNLTENSLTLKEGSGGYAAHEKALNNLKESVGLLENALDKAFNKDLGTLNIAKFNKELHKLDIKKIEKDMAFAGAAGTAAFRNVAAQALTTNVQLKQTSTLVNKISETLSNTIKWNLASSLVNNFTGKIQQAYGYVKHLDGSLNDIRIVTGKSADEMDRFAKIANNAAKDLGKSTTEYTDAALIYYQQGLNEADVQARTEVTLKAANVTGQNADDVSEQLTAVWNGYQVSAQEAELYIDKLAAVAATTAADLEELSTGMSKVASAASIMGVDIDQLNAQLATIVSITRQAPESVGTALKTIYARMGDIEAGLDSETTLGTYTSVMAEMGFNVLDMNGNLRDMGEIIEEIGEKWSSMTREQQISLSQTVAGTRQYNNLLALFDNWDMYTEAVNTSIDAMGTLQKQNEIYLDSTAAHLAQAETKWEDLYDSILDEDTINTVADLIGDIADVLATVVDGLGGGVETFKLLGSVATIILRDKISKGIVNVIRNFNSAKHNAEQFKAHLNTIEMFKGADDKAVKQMAAMRDEALKYGSVMNAERQKEVAGHIENINRLHQQKAEWEENKKKALEYYQIVTGEDNPDIDFTKNASTKNQAEVTEKIKQWKNSFNDAKQGLGKSEKTLNKLNQQLIDLQKGTAAGESGLDKLRLQAGKLSKETIESVQSLDDFATTLLKRGKALPEELGEAHRAYLDLVTEKSFDINIAEDKDARQIVTNFVKAFKKASPELEGEIKHLEHYYKLALSGIGESTEEELSNAQKSFKSFIQNVKLESLVNSTISIANGINQINLGLSTLIGIKDIWKDDTIEDSEKFGQTLSAIGGGIGSIIFAMPILKTGIITLAEAVGVTNAATLGLKGSVVALGSSIKAALGAFALPVAIIGGVIALLPTLIKLYDKMTISAEEAAEKLKQAREEYKEVNTTLEDTENKLIDVQKRIKEINDLGYISLTDEKELEKLKEEEILLKTQLELLKQKRFEKLKTTADEVKRNIKKGNYGIDTDAEIDSYIESSSFFYQDETGEYRYESPWGEGSAGSAEIAAAVDLLINRKDYKSDYIKNEIARLENEFKKSGAVGMPQEQFNNVITLLKSYANGDGILDYDYSNFDLTTELENLQAVKEVGDEESTKRLQKIIANYYREKNVAGFNVKQVFGQFSAEQINKFKNEVSGDGFTIEDLTEEELISLQEAANSLGISIESLLFDFATYENEIGETATETEIKLANLEKQINSLKQEISEINGIIDSLKSGKELTEEQIAELEKLENEYEFLGRIIDKTSDEYIEALQKAQDLKEEEAIELADRKTAEIATKLDVNGSAKAFNQTMEELLNAEYEVIVNIKADTKSDFENAVNQLDEMTELTSKIGDGFVVSAEDIAKLGTAFPGILDGITQLEDGTIKLSQKSVESAKDVAESKIKISTETAISEIEAQNEILIAEKERYENALRILKTTTDQGKLISELDAEKKGDINSALSALEITNAQNVAEEENQYTIDAQKAFVENHNKALAEAGKTLEKWAKTARYNFKYAYTGQMPSDGELSFDKIFDAELPEFKNLTDYYQSSDSENGPSAIFNFSQIDAFLERLSDDRADQLEQQYNNITLLEELIASYDETINANNAYIEELKLRGEQGVILLNNIAAGLGSDGVSDAELLELLDEEYDRYHDINIEIQKITNSLSKLEKQQDKLLGQDLIQNLEEQLELLEKQKAAQEVKLIIAKQEQEELKRRLTEDYGATFTGDTISNYKALYTEQFNKILEMQKAYNNMSKEEQEKYEKEIEAEEKKFEKFKELLEEYENLTYEEIQNIEEEIQDSIDRIVEYQVEMFTFDINFKIDSTEFAKEFSEFKKRFLDNIKEDDFLGNALANLANFGLYYDANSNGLIQGLTTQINDTINQIKQIEETGTSSIYGNNRAKAMEDLKSYGEELMKQLENVQGLVDEIKQSYLDMMGEAQEKFDEQISMYEYIAELVNSDMNIVKLLYGEDSYKEFERFYDVMKENHLKNIDFQRQQTEFWYEQMNAAEEGSEAWEAAKQNYLDSLSGLNAEIEAAIQNLLDSYENTINRIFDDLNKSLTGGMGLDHISQEWELMNEVADQYLDTTNAAFEIRQLERKWIDAINNSSLGAQAELNQLMGEQLEMLREKDKLTQYDVERANALYDIALKEIALKEAQQNKSKMRLRRDAQGNYTYQYVSDEDAVAQAQQELDEARNSLYNMDKDAYKENLDTIYGYYEEFEAAMKELYADASLTEEERQAKKLQLIEYYEQLINNAIAENGVIRANLQDTMETTLGTSLNDFMMGEYIPQWNSGIQQMADKFAAEGGLIPVCQEALGKLDGATKEYEESLDELEKSASIDFEAIKDGYNSNIPLVEELIIDNDELITSYESQLEAIGNVIGEVETLIGKYQDAKIAADQATEAAYKYWQEQNKDTPANDKPKEDNSSSGGKSGGGSSISGQSGSNGGTGKSAGDGVPTQGEVVTFARGQYYAASDQTGRSGNQSLGEQVTITKIHAGAKLPIHIANSRYALGWVREDQLEGFRTGGYTGEWTGDDGRLGVLHKKELILNQQDTSNILNAVHIARTMSNILDSISMAARARMSSMSAGATSGFSTLGAMASELQQNVTIHADFPNATNHSEIEEAFNNLLNTASQYAFRNGRG